MSVDTEQRQRAKSLRRSMTDAEWAVWYHLRHHRFFGRSFRRQTPVGPHIVDFLCHAERLSMEIDGAQHLEPDHALKDARRDAFLRATGFRVLRFTNLDVLSNLEGVLTTIARVIGEGVAPTLPSPAGRGGE